MSKANKNQSIMVPLARTYISVIMDIIDTRRNELDSIKLITDIPVIMEIMGAMYVTCIMETYRLYKRYKTGSEILGYCP